MSPFLTPGEGESALWPHSPPGPAVMRREWCAQEEAGATEYKDPLAPRPGVHRMTITDVSEGDEYATITLTGLGGRRMRTRLRRGSGPAPTVGVEVRARIRERGRAHFVTPTGFHLVGPYEQGGWCIFRSAAEAEREAGSREAEIVGGLSQP